MGAVEAPVNLTIESQPTAREKLGSQVQQMLVEGDDRSTAMATEASAPPSRDATYVDLTEIMELPTAETTGAEANDLEKDMSEGASDEADVVQIESDEEFELRPRSAGGCGFCAQQTDVSYSFCFGLISCDVQQNAGLSYCRCC